MNTLLNFGELLKEPVNQTINHFINKLGLTSIVTAGSITVAEHQQIIAQGNGVTDWLKVMALVGSILFIVQKIVETVCTIALTRHKMKGK